MDRHQGHLKGPDHGNRRGTINQPTLNNNHGTPINRIATTNRTTTRTTTTMVSTEGTTITTITTIRDTAETTTTTTTTTTEDLIKRTISHPRILKEECTG